jgi:hypothetical protein
VPLDALLLALVDAPALALLEALLLAAPPAPVVAAPPPVPLVPGLPPAPLELEAVVDAPVPLLVAAPPDPVVLPLAELVELSELLDEGSGEEHAGASSGVATIARMAVSGSFIFTGSPSRHEAPRRHPSRGSSWC